MTELERLLQAIERQYAARPAAQFGAVFIGSRDYAAYDAWISGLETLRRDLIDVCEGRLEYACDHPTGAHIRHPHTKKLYCDLCGKEIK